MFENKVPTQDLGNVTELKRARVQNVSPFSGDFRMSKISDKSYSVQVLSKSSMWEHLFT